MRDSKIVAVTIPLAVPTDVMGRVSVNRIDTGTSAQAGVGRSAITTSWINPLEDPRWTSFVDGHPHASIFHTAAWLEALRRAYGYEPAALVVQQPDGRLTGGMAFCRVSSWLTGARLVSLPFSDHADPLVEAPEDRRALIDALRAERSARAWKYVEFRSTVASGGCDDGFVEANRYCLHRLDLRSSLDALVDGLHRNHVRRKIRRSEREGLTYEEGRSTRLLDAFYGLVLQTRRRHQLPPQPLKWFRAILDCLPEQAKLRVAYRGATPISSILTLCDGRTMMYKYGASAAEFHALGGMHLLLWRTILDAREQGCITLDLGRSDIDNEGLLAFKDHWGAARTALAYWRYPAAASGERVTRANRTMARRIFAMMPDRVLIATGAALYRHIG